MGYKLKLYNMDLKYIRDLANVDDNVMSTSPQVNKESRPFVGIIVICDEKKYCIPLSSPKPKHFAKKNDKDFSRIIDKNNKLIGVLNFNNMIPVNTKVVSVVNINPRRNDSSADIHYKQLLKDQLLWCNDNIDNINNKANKLYKIVTQTPEKYRNLTRRCCDFKKLEQVLERYMSKHFGSDQQVTDDKDDPQLSIKENPYYIKITSDEQLDSLQKNGIPFRPMKKKEGMEDLVVAVNKKDSKAAKECIESVHNKKKL